MLILCRLEIPNMEERAVDQSPSMCPRPYTMRECDHLGFFATLMVEVATVEGLLHHRYVPAVGQPGKHDASYPIFVPGAGDRKPPYAHLYPIHVSTANDSPRRRITSSATTKESIQDCRLQITRRTWEELPTIWNIVEGLAGLQLGEVREVAIQVGAGAGDVAGARRI